MDWMKLNSPLTPMWREVVNSTSDFLRNLDETPRSTIQIKPKKEREGASWLPAGSRAEETGREEAAAQHALATWNKPHGKRNNKKTTSFPLHSIEPDLIFNC